MVQAPTGYPSIDKPWLKYYSEEAIHAPAPAGSIYDHIYRLDKDHLKIGFGIKMRKLGKNFLQDSMVLIWKDFAASAKGQPEITFKKDPASLCCLAHTGSTTGFPKTVLINDLSLNILAQQYDKCAKHER